jgi:uncharacterized protein (DUF433 family)
MPELPSNEFVELRNGAYYIRGTRIGLRALIWPLRRGEDANYLADGFPTFGPEKIQGIIAFINDNPAAIEQYLKEEDERWEEIKKMFPMDPELARQWHEGTQKYREYA